MNLGLQNKQKLSSENILIKILSILFWFSNFYGKLQHSHIYYGHSLHTSTCNAFAKFIYYVLYIITYVDFCK